MKNGMFFLAFCICVSVSGYGQAQFFINERYAKHLSEGRVSGRAEVAFFAIQVEQKDTCWILKQFGRTDSENQIDPNSFKERVYCTQEHTPKFVSACTRKPSEGLFKHYHSEHQEWIEWESDTTILLRRCGWAKRVNRFIQADSSRYFQK